MRRIFFDTLIYKVGLLLGLILQQSREKYSSNNFSHILFAHKVKFTIQQATKAQRRSRDGDWVANATPRLLYPRRKTRAGWVGPRAGLDGFGKPRPHRDSIPGPSSPYRVAKPTELSRSTFLKHTRYKNKCIIVYDTQCVS